MTNYAFIDGEFFRNLCKVYGDKIDFPIFERIDWRKVSGFGERVFFYDSLPSQKNGQSEIDHDLEVQTKISEFKLISSNRGLFVKDGVSKFRQRDRRREQKGVDVLLAVDVLQYAYKGIVDSVSIYTSDLDFFPLFEALQGTRCRGLLFCQEGRTSEELMQVADQAHHIGISQLMSLTGHGPGEDENWFPSFREVVDGQERIIYEQEALGGRTGRILFDAGNSCFHFEIEENGRRQRRSGAKSALLAIEWSRGVLSLPYALEGELINKVKNT